MNVRAPFRSRISVSRLAGVVAVLMSCSTGLAQPGAAGDGSPETAGSPQKLGVNFEATMHRREFLLISGVAGAASAWGQRPDPAKLDRIAIMSLCFSSVIKSAAHPDDPKRTMDILDFADLMAQRKNLQLERRTAPKRARKRGDERHNYGTERQSINEGQSSLYQSDRNLREPQSDGCESNPASLPK